MICAAVCFSLALLCVTYAWWVTQRNWKQERERHDFCREGWDEEKRISAQLRQQIDAEMEHAAALQAQFDGAIKQRDLERAKRDEFATKLYEQTQRWLVTRRTILEAIGGDK